MVTKKKPAKKKAVKKKTVKKKPVRATAPKKNLAVKNSGSTAKMKPRGKGFKKGQSGNPNGRKKGSENKVTKDTRQAVQLIVEANIEKMQSWINRVATKDPEAAANIVLKLLEYHVPKLQRTDHTSGDLPIDPVVNIYVRGVSPESDG